MSKIPSQGIHPIRGYPRTSHTQELEGDSYRNNLFVEKRVIFGQKWLILCRIRFLVENLENFEPYYAQKWMILRSKMYIFDEKLSFPI